jgi:hypothetical protein
MVALDYRGNENNAENNTEYMIHIADSELHDRENCSECKKEQESKCRSWFIRVGLMFMFGGALMTSYIFYQ